MHTEGYIQWQERFHAHPIDDGYTKGHWNMPYVSEEVAIEPRRTDGRSMASDVYEDP
jgi:hypothetical protein